MKKIFIFYLFPHLFIYVFLCPYDNEKGGPNLSLKLDDIFFKSGVKQSLPSSLSHTFSTAIITERSCTHINHLIFLNYTDTQSPQPIFGNNLHDTVLFHKHLFNVFGYMCLCCYIHPPSTSCKVPGPTGKQELLLLLLLLFGGLQR